MNDKNLSYRAAEVYRTIIAYIESHGYPPTQSEISELCFYSTYITYTPLYNFINDTLVSESTVLRHLLRHLILYRFRLFP